jgi:hypothetical protein
MKVTVLLATMMVVLSTATYSGDEKPKDVTLPGSKLYVIYLVQWKSYVLEAVEGVDFNGVKCLKGRHADISWARGKICYIPIDQISTIVEYDSLQQYKEDIEKYRNQQLK